MSIKQSSARTATTRVLIVSLFIGLAAVITAAASWTDYINPFAFFTSANESASTALDNDARGAKPTDSPTVMSSTVGKDNSEPTNDAVNLYPVTRTTGITFSSISGTGTSVGSWRNGTSLDDNLSNSLPIGFNFTYNGGVYQNFRLSTNGFITFNTSSTAVGGTSSTPYNYENVGMSSNSASTNYSPTTLAPMWDDLTVPAAGTLAGNIKYLTTGSSPNRILTVEWIGMEVFSNAGPDLNFQVKLYEVDGHIEYIYGTMTPSSATYSYSTGINAQTLSTTPTAAELLTQQTANTATFSNTASNALSTVPAANTQLTFTPPTTTPAAATGLSFPNKGATFAQMTWTDNATNETNYNLLISSDGGTTYQTFGAILAANTNGATVTGLSPSTTYFFRVLACTEAVCSSALDSSVTTNATVTGTKTIGAGGDYPSFALAITDVNAGVGGTGVTFNIAAGTTFAENGTCITGGSVTTPVIFQRSGAGANPIIQPPGSSSTQDSGICILGGDYVTFDGIDVIAANNTVEYGALVFNSSATNGAQNNTIKNARIVLDRTNTSSIGINQTFSVAATSAAGTQSTNKYYNITIENASRGILFNGSSTTVLDTSNEIGITGGGTTTIGAATANDIGNGTAQTYGIRATAQSGVKIFNVEVRNVTGTGTGAVDGIFLDNTGSGTTSVGTNQIFNNKIHDLNNTSTSAGVVRGIRENLTNNAASISQVYNNFIWNLDSFSTVTTSRRIIGINSQDSGSGTASTHNISNNSVRLSPTSGISTVNTCFEIGVSTNINKIQNNIFANFTGAQTGSAKHYTWVSTSASSFGGAGSVSDFNELHVANSTNGFIALGSSTDFATLATWQAMNGATAGPDDASITTDPKFFTATDLHIIGTSPAIDTIGTTIATYTTDIDGQTRPTGTKYDVGADEYVAAAGSLQLSSSTYSGNEGTTLTATVTRSGGDSGTVGATYTLTDGTAVGGATCNGTNDYINPGPTTVSLGTNVTSTTFNITLCTDAVLEGPQAFTITLSLPTGGATLGSPTSATATIGDIAPAFNGSYNVGTGEILTSLTNTGGIFDAINTTGATGNITINITSNLTSETGAVALNQIAGGFTVLIRPSGAPRTISGALSSNALVRLNGADGVTIDGSTSGGTDRSLTITNTATTAPSGVSLISLGTGLGATGNTVKNCNISTGVATSIGYGIAVGGTLPGSTGADNDTTTIQNNSITVAPVGIYATGTASVSTGGNDGLAITGNTVDYNGTLAGIGIQVGQATGASVSQNTVTEQTTATQSPTGISLETGFVSSSVTRNLISKSVNTNASGYGGRGMTVGTGSATSSLTIANNMIYGVNGTDFSSFTNSSSMGMVIGTVGNSSTLTTTAGGINLYFNSVRMTGNMGAASTSALTAALYVGSGASALDVRDNLFASTQVGNNASQKNYAIFSAAAKTAYTTIDYNDYFVSNTFNAGSAILGNIGTTDLTTLAAIQNTSTGFGQNVSSKAADPNFTSTTNLHIKNGAADPVSPVARKGVTISGITTDYDADTRKTTPEFPDIGADEFNTYLVTYDGNTNTGGTAPVDAASPYNPGATVTVQGAGSLVKTGYTFDHWNTAANNSGTSYAPAATFTASANTTLYAQWTVNQYSVIYDGNGNTAGTAPATQTADYNTSVTLSGAGSLVKTGYTFTGWNTAANGSGTAYSAGQSFTIPASNTTLYAQWTINTYTVTYNNNGGTGSQTDPNSPYNYGSTVTVLGTGSIARTGYTFAHWNTAADDSGTSYNPADTFTLGAANVVLYAQWTISTYAITSSAGTGGTISPNGVTNVPYDTNQAYTVTANAGYVISDVVVDSVSQGAISSYTFMNVSATHTISASFALNNTTFNTDGNLPAGSYNNVVINGPAVVTLTGDSDIQGCVTINSGGTLLMGTYIFSGPGCFTLNSGGSLGIGNTAGIAATAATGSVQVAGARSYSSGATYIYNGTASQAVGDGLPLTVANLTIANTGPDGPTPAADNTVTGNSGQIVTALLNVVDGVYESHSDYADVTIEAAGTLTLTGPTTVSGNWTNNGGTLTGNFPVTFDGATGQTITGNTTFYALTKSITTPAQQMNFAAGSTTTVTNALTLTGTAGNLLSLRSTASGTQWNLNATGTRSVDYVDVQDSDATGSGSAVNATNSVGLAANNTNWTFNTVANYTITVTQTANGTISPGTTTLPSGSTQAFNIVPATGYDIATLTVDGTPVTPVQSPYTFTNITSDHTITATYAPASCRTISIPDSSSTTGVAVSIPVNTTDVTGGNVLSAQFKVTYDPSVITPIAGADNVVVTPGPVLPSGTTIDINRGTPGVIEFSINGTVPFTGSGALVEMHMNVIGAPGTSTALTLSAIDPSFPTIFYNGGTVCANAVSGSHSVIATTTTTTVTSSPAGTSVYGDNVTFTATVAPAFTGGTVQFVIDGNNVGSPVAVVGGVANYSTTTLPVTGSPHNITANFSGFSPYSGSSGSISHTITARPITVTAATDTRGYDGTTASSAAPTITSGTLANSDTAGFTQTFDTKHVGTGKTLTASGAVNDGFGGTNYAVTFVANTTGVITARAITVTAATDTRGYDGTTSSAGIPTITSGSLATGDTAAFTQTFDTRHVGTGKTLTAAGSVTDGNSGNNYAVTFVANTTGVITARAITVTAATDTRGYNGTTTSAGVPTITSGSLASGDTATFTQTFDTKHVGTGKTLTASGTVTDGNGGNNYVVTFVADTTGVITARAITVTAATDTRGYDGTTSSTGVPTITSGSLAGGDTATFTQTFDTKHVGTGKTLTAAGTVSDGNGGNNYAVTFVANTTGVITARAITVTAATDTRVYDGTTSSAGVPTVTSGSLASGDTSGFTQTFDTKHVGTGKTLTASGAVNDGNGGNNYAVTFVTNTTGVITAKAITVTAVTDTKGYDGTTSSAGTPLISPALVGGDTSGFTQTFDTKHVGTGKTLTAAGTVSDGNSGNNYVVTFVANTTGVITARAITVTAATDTKVYDGTTSSAGVPTITSGSLASGDTATFTQTFDTKHVGTGKTLTAAGTVSDGNSGNNYVVTFVANTTGVITARAITVTAATDTRGYDGTTSSAGVPTITSGSLASGDTATFTQTFDTKHVGTGKTLTAAGTVTDGNSGNNYAVTFVANTTGVITARAITVTAATDTKVYDGTTSSAGVPTITSGSLAVGDTATFTQTFDTKHVGTGKTLTASGPVTDGNGGNNYAVTYVANTTGVITAKAITVTAATDTRGYDGTTSSAGVPLISPALAAGDTSGFTQTFDTKHVGTGKTLTASGSAVDGNSGNNYSVTFVADTTGVITARAITVTAATDTRVYDGTTTSTGTPTITSGSLAPGDTAVFSQTFDTRHVGTGKTLTASGTVTDGNSGNNYAVTYVANTMGVITAKSATWTTDPASKTFGDADPVPLTTGSGTGFLAIDGVTATYTRAPGEAAGIYHITATLNAATGDLNDYSITNAGADFTINARTLTGQVTYGNAASGIVPVPHTTLTSTGPAPLPAPVENGLDGNYSITGFGAGSYTITPSKAPYVTNVFNGIFADDASLISQHVVHLITLNPTQQSAAQVGGLGTVTAFDASLVAQYIVGIPNALNSSGSWKFNPASTSLIVSPASVQDFSGILMGDVNGDWEAETSRPAQLISTDAANSVRVSLPNTYPAPGSSVTVPLKIENLGGAGVRSYQFDVEYNPAVITPAEVAATISGTISEGLHVVSNAPAPGLLKVVVYGANPVTGDGVYVNLQFSTISGTGSTSPLNIRAFRFNDGQTPVFTFDGSVTITSTSETMIRGRLMTPFGAGVPNATVMLTNSAGTRVWARSSSLGYFEFGSLVVGETYTVSVKPRQYTFTPQTVTLTPGVTGLDMIANQ